MVNRVTGLGNYDFNSKNMLANSKALDFNSILKDAIYEDAMGLDIREEDRAGGFDIKPYNLMNMNLIRTDDIKGDNKNKLLMVLMMMMDNSFSSSPSMPEMLLSLSSFFGTDSPNFFEGDRDFTRSGVHISEARSLTNEPSLIPREPHKAVNPGIISTIDNRSPRLYREVIDQFRVESNPRYANNQRGKNDTYCNIFMWDVTRAMGAEIPHYVDPKTLEPRYYPDVKGARELNANGIYDWLVKVGHKYGWERLSPREAQEMANQGRPVVTTKYNKKGPGHVQIVSPSKDGSYDETRGLSIAQAGRKLINDGYISDVYRSSSPDVLYFGHP